MSEAAAPPRRALLLSPHLDDVAFSCGGTAAALAASGWAVAIATVFTRSVHPASGFALACQRDKGLADEVDYMAVRRREDREACDRLGAEQILMDLPEAPNRGYDSAAALFAGARPGDGIVASLSPLLSRLLEQRRPDLVLAPQGCGSHVDHAQLIAALLPLLDVLPATVGFYRDTPYVIRDPAALPDPRVASLPTRAVSVPLDDAARARKLAAVGCFGTQLGFQFGGAAAAEAAIDALMEREAGGAGRAERLLLLGDADRLAGVAA